MHGVNTGCPFAKTTAQDAARPKAADTAPPGYGPAQPGDYRGVEGKGKRDDARTDKLFRAIQERSFRGDDLADQPLAPESALAPAGYTYLGQFAAHDLTLSSVVGQGPKTAREPVNGRHRPLLLDSLYGEPGATRTPWLSGFDSAGAPLKAGWPATRFVLSTPDGAPMRGKQLPAASPARDIGRAIVSAPADRPPSAYDLFVPGASSGIDFGVPVIADPRNDDQPLIAQLTALFKIAHNLALDLLDKAAPPKTPAAAKQNFDIARLALTAVFRQILRDDLLKRLLDPVVHAHYLAPGASFLDDADAKRPISRDFAHAAYRACHAMIRPIYPFNADNAHRLRLVLDNTSSYRGGVRVPLSASWIVDWSQLFAVKGSDPARARPLIPQFSAALRDLPLPTSPTSPPSDGLLYKDLWSGALSRIRRIDTLLALVRVRQPELAAASPWLKDGARGKAALKSWWKGGGSGDAAWMEKEVAANPPPLLYFLAEAAAASGGRHFGPLGSIVVADTFFRALAVEPTPVGTTTAKSALQRVFGKKSPAGMPALVEWIDARLDTRHKRSKDGEAMPFAS